MSPASSWSIRHVCTIFATCEVRENPTTTSIGRLLHRHQVATTRAPAGLVPTRSLTGGVVLLLVQLRATTMSRPWT